MIKYLLLVGEFIKCSAMSQCTPFRKGKVKCQDKFFPKLIRNLFSYRILSVSRERSII